MSHSKKILRKMQLQENIEKPGRFYDDASFRLELQLDGFV